MGYIVEVQVRVGTVTDGGGGVMLGQSQANVPGQGQITQNPRPVMNAQVRQYIDAEAVPGGNAPTLANINTALTNAVTAIAGASGTPLITAAELAIIQGWATGNP